jgi:hypothetical protein
MVTTTPEFLKFRAPSPLVARARAEQLRVSPGRRVPKLAAVLRAALDVGLDVLASRPVDVTSAPVERA